MTEDELFNDWLKIIDTSVLHKTLNLINPERICPKKDLVFKSFRLCPLKECKVVFLGQDPYPQEGVATGILFGNSVDTAESDLSPSLKVLKEAVIDYSKSHNYPIEFDNSLESWAKQGILMLNSALTVEVNKIGSHTAMWRPFISKFLETLSNYESNIVYVLFGKQAQTFEPYINKHKNYILKENHPAYYARTNKIMPSIVFYKINEYLVKQYNTQIIWYKEFNGYA